MMNRVRRLSFAGTIFLASVLLTYMAFAIEPAEAVTAHPTSQPESPLVLLSGIVVDQDGPIAGARVRVQATQNMTYAHDDGMFLLSVLDSLDPMTVTAWSKGYYNGAATGVAGSDPFTITLRPHFTTDNANYDWIESGNGARLIRHRSQGNPGRLGHRAKRQNPAFAFGIELNDQFDGGPLSQGPQIHDGFGLVGMHRQHGLAGNRAPSHFE